MLFLILPLLFCRVSFLFVDDAAVAAATVVVFLLFFFKSFGALSALYQCKFCAKAKHFYARVFITHHTHSKQHTSTHTIGVPVCYLNEFYTCLIVGFSRLSCVLFIVVQHKTKKRNKEATTIHAVHGMAIFFDFFSFLFSYFLQAIAISSHVHSSEQTNKHTHT